MPPLLALDDARHPIFDEKYQDKVDKKDLPKGESLKMTVERVLPFWFDWIVPQIKAGNNPLVVAHGNSLRGIIKKLREISDEDILTFSIPTAAPMVFEFDENMNLVNHYFLMSEDELRERKERLAGMKKDKRLIDLYDAFTSLWKQYKLDKLKKV